MAASLGSELPISRSIQVEVSGSCMEHGGEERTNHEQFFLNVSLLSSTSTISAPPLILRLHIHHLSSPTFYLIKCILILNCIIKSHMLWPSYVIFLIKVNAHILNF